MDGGDLGLKKKINTWRQPWPRTSQKTRGNFGLNDGKRNEPSCPQVLLSKGADLKTNGLCAPANRTC